MHSSIINKIEKARRYSQEPERVSLNSLEAGFHGDHADYTLSYRDGKWHCSCAFFSKWQLCSHTMATQRILSIVLPQETVANL